MPAAMSDRPLLPHELGWERWQGSTLSKRLLPERTRQEGYTVLRVPKPLRPLFLDLATIFALYDQGCQRPKVMLSQEQLQTFLQLSDVVKAMIEVLRKESR